MIYLFPLKSIPIPADEKKQKQKRRNRWWWRGDTEACTDRQDRQGNVSFFALTHARDWTFTWFLSLLSYGCRCWSMMLHNFFKHYAQRENFVRPISCVVLTSNDGRKGANFNILIDIYFLPFYFLFFPFFNFILYLFFLLSLVVKRAGRIDCKGNCDVIN